MGAGCNFGSIALDEGIWEGENNRGRMLMYILVQSIYDNYWHNLKQIATAFLSPEMHSGEVSLKHTKNPLRHLWGKQVKFAIIVTFSH